MTLPRPPHAPRRRRETLVTVALIAAVAGTVLWQSAGGTHVPHPVAALSPAPQLLLGVTTEALARNAYEPWRAADLTQVDAFEDAAQRHADIVMWYADWAHTPRFDAAQARAVARRGSVPEISWEPWDSTQPLGRAQPRFSLRGIAAGADDPYLRRWARGIAAYGGPLRLRFAQEMNGRWYPWGLGHGNRPGDFRAAWLHVRAVFRAAGARNVIWIWAPVGGAVPRALYPGDDAVDVVGVSGFNGGPELFRHAWRPFRTAFDETLDRLHELAPGKPVALSEVGSTETGGSKAAWIRAMFADIARRPYVHSLTWFDLDKETDWRITSSPSARAAFAAGLRPLARARAVVPRQAQPLAATRSR
jgi:hypothetical protein